MNRVPRARHTKEVREEVVNLAKAVGASEASRPLSIPLKTLAYWLRASGNGKLAEIGRQEKPLTEAEAELYRLKRELAEVKMERDLLKSLRRTSRRKTCVVSTHCQRCATCLKCRRGYYALRKRGPSVRSQQEPRLEMEIRAAHRRTRETCGPERLQRDLAEHGVIIGVHRIKRLRKKLGLRCKQKRRCKAATDSRHTLPIAPNVLNQDFACSAPSQVWCGDIRTHFVNS